MFTINRDDGHVDLSQLSYVLLRCTQQSMCAFHTTYNGSTYVYSLFQAVTDIDRIM